jgi:crotonobetainyl-CoA:carnitine CoA-transferase CaiB-like acyl-CoA transferase
VDHPKIGKVRVINSPFKFSETESKLRGPCPELGEHNREILSRLLDYSDEEIKDLYAEGILFSKA